MTAVLESESDDNVSVSFSFGDGITVDLNACSGDPGYVDAVLFKDGHELATCEPGDEIEGEYSWSIGNDTFTLIVE